MNTRQVGAWQTSLAAQLDGNNSDYDCCDHNGNTHQDKDLTSVPRLVLCCPLQLLASLPYVMVHSLYIVLDGV